jgi:hypothetical protein
VTIEVAVFEDDDRGAGVFLSERHALIKPVTATTKPVMATIPAMMVFGSIVYT